MNYNESLFLDVASITLEDDFDLLLKRRSAILETALLEKDFSLLESIMDADQYNLTQLYAAHAREGECIVNISKVVQYYPVEP